MIYLDYAADTPVDEEILKEFCHETRTYYGNPNSTHGIGVKAKERMDTITKEIADIFQVKQEEIIYTSGASESNNLAIKGVAFTYRHKGKHIISTCLEHSSVSGGLTALQNQGYEIDLVDINSDGQVDLEHLNELIREDTILVSICYVDSELGVLQPVSEIAKIVKSKNCFLHVDATQGIGKIEISTKGVDLLSFSPHKFYGLAGSGVLIRKKNVILEPLIHGGASTTIYRSGTPALGLAFSILKSLKKAELRREANYKYVEGLNHYLLEKLRHYPLVRINSTDKSIPHIINLSIKGIRGSRFQKELSKRNVCVSVKSACSVTETPSRPVYAITKDKKNAMGSWRISLSHLTTKKELDEFMQRFEECYKFLTEEK